MSRISLTLDFVLKVLNSLIFIFLILFFILIYNIILYFTQNRKFIKSARKVKDPETISIADLNNIPLVNIIIPAWKEGDLFRECLSSIKNLKYPKIKVIVNAGGNEETLNIANSFRNNENFIILHQKGGADRPSLGKIKAINECLAYISEGIVYFIDADSYLNDEILLRMIFPIINDNESLVGGGVRPLESQENNKLVKYLLINRVSLKSKVTRWSSNADKITGQNLCLKYEVIKAIGKFKERPNIPTDRSMAQDIFSEGFQLYSLVDQHHRIFVDYSNTIKEYIRQKTIWIENFLIYSYKNKKLGSIKFILLFLAYLYLFIFPFFLLLNFGLFMIGIFIIIYQYLKEARKYLVYTRTTKKEYRQNINFTYFFTIIFYIYVEAIIIIRIPIHLMIFFKKLKSKK